MKKMLVALISVFALIGIGNVKTPMNEGRIYRENDNSVVVETDSSVTSETLDSSIIEISDSQNEPVEETDEPSQLAQIIDQYLAPAIVYAVANIGTFLAALFTFFKKLRKNTNNVEQNSKDLERLKSELSKTIISIQELVEAVDKTAETMSEIDDIEINLSKIVEALKIAFGTNCSLIEKGIAKEVLKKLDGEKNENEENTEETEN